MNYMCSEKLKPVFQYKSRDILKIKKYILKLQPLHTNVLYGYSVDELFVSTLKNPYKICNIKNQE